MQQASTVSGSLRPGLRRGCRRLENPLHVVLRATARTSDDRSTIHFHPGFGKFRHPGFLEAGTPRQQQTVASKFQARKVEARPEGEG